MASPRERWITEGLTVLAAEGAPAVRVDRIAHRLGLTKGSFHHHFQGADDYRRALLDRHEQDQMAELDRLAAEAADVPADVVLAMLPTLVARQIDNDLARAVRAWAISDPSARKVQQRLDEARLTFLQNLWTRILGDANRAHIAALVPHLIAVGASVAQPRLTTTQLNSVYALLAALAPGVTADEPPGSATTG